MDPVTLAAWEAKILMWLMRILIVVSLPLGGYFYGHHDGYLERVKEDENAVAKKKVDDIKKTEVDTQYQQQQGENLAKAVVATHNYWVGESSRLLAAQARRSSSPGQKPIQLGSSACGEAVADGRVSQAIRSADAKIRAGLEDLQREDERYKAGIAGLLESSESKQLELQTVIDAWNRGLKVNAVDQAKRSWLERVTGRGGAVTGTAGSSP